MSLEQKTAPYGTWSSPISAEAITKKANSIEDVIVDSVTSKVYHLERRPSEKGRSALVETQTGTDVFGPEWNIRTGVQEYGGSPVLIHNGTVYFSNFADGRIYKFVDGSEPTPLTPEGKPYRFANITIHPTVPHLFLAVLEDHTVDTPATVETSICLIDTSTSPPTLTPKLISGSDFYALPLFSPNGKKLAWLQWAHPDMPWQGGEIYVADVTLESNTIHVQNAKHVAGKKSQVSACYPSWANDSTLLFTSDVTGFVNPWKYDVTTGKASALLESPIDEDFAQPFWVLGEFPYAKISGGGVFYVGIRSGRDVLYYLDKVDGDAHQLQEFDTPYVSIHSIRSVGSDEVVFTGQKADAKSAIVSVSLSSLRASSPKFKQLSITPPDAVFFPLDLVSPPRPITLQLPGNEGPLHVVLYLPHNPEYAGTSVEGEKPPVVVNVHGGPTAYVQQGLNWSKQYFTSRGWAWLDVNYRGSSGYGRAYIERLESNWGLVDVQDCIASVKLLSSSPYDLIDPKRACIRGGSAGGYTVLAAISIPTNPEDRTVFAAAQSSYGISDLKKLMEFTHKFESQYLFKLVGGTYDEVPAVYDARSPIGHVDNIKTPLLILQGEIDKIVPKEQAELIYDSIKKANGVVEYKLYPGEGHGWRQEGHLKDALERELDFYERVLKLKTNSV